MAQVQRWAAAHKLGTTAIVIATLLVTLAAALGIAQATDRSTFCGSACHEMGPFHSAWSQGPHRDVACVECHVEPGTVARVSHKAEAMKELWVHISGDPKFPLPSSAEVPNERCLRCHENVQIKGFDHAQHSANRQCVQCHATAGHNVAASSLSAAGVLSAVTRSVPVSAGAFAVVDAGSANVPGHVPVSCTRCHDLAKTGCQTCHQPKHQNTGTATKTASCQTCHTAGAKFAFVHPKGSDLDCGSCHQQPAEKHDFSGDCAGCHTQPGTSWAFDHNDRANCADCHKPPAKHFDGSCSKCHVAGAKWAFKHPGSSADCTSCHNRPAGHRSGSCTTCHTTGTSWAFRHPAGQSCTNCHNRPAGHRSGSCTSCHRAGASWAFRHPSGGSCTGCHNRPSGHKSGSCSTCHRAGVSWRFRHPGQSARCTSCHNRPGGHSSGQCSSCHRAGTSWAFRHSSGLRCSSCHNPPSGHFSGACSSCHSPSRSWSSATFSHPHIRGGEHTYKSFACKSCHPNGYSSATCIKCHSTSSGPKDD